MPEVKANSDNLVNGQEGAGNAKINEKLSELDQNDTNGALTTRNRLDSILPLSQALSSKSNDGSTKMTCSAIQSDSSSDSDSDNGSESSTKDGDDLGDNECGKRTSFSSDYHNSQDVLSDEDNSQDYDKESSNKVTVFNNDAAPLIQAVADSKDGTEEDDASQTLLTEAAQSRHDIERATEINEKINIIDNASQVFDRLRREGVEVLKLNREKNWQSRFLTITAETQFAGNASIPVGLLWLKRFDQGKPYTLASIDKKGKGGILFNGIESIAVTKDKNALNRKQKNGKFKDSITFALYSNKREILFRCMTKEDAFALSLGFQAILDHIRSAQQKAIKKFARGRGQLKVITTSDSMQELDSTTPVESDQWEL